MEEKDKEFEKRKEAEEINRVRTETANEILSMNFKEKLAFCFGSSELKQKVKMKP